MYPVRDNVFLSLRVASCIAIMLARYMVLVSFGGRVCEINRDFGTAR